MKIQYSKHDYAIYKVEFREDSEKSIENHDKDSKQYLKIAETCFASLFDDKSIKALYKLTDKGSSDPFPNDVLHKEDDIILWRVNNIQLKKLWLLTGKDANGTNIYEEKDEESYPFCNVIIDNRKDICQMAIEKSSAWNIDKLVELIQQSFHRLLSDKYGLTLSIEAKMLPTEFWEFVHTRIKEHDDYIRKISFEFSNPKKVKGVDLPNIQCSRLKALKKITEMSEAIKGYFQMEFDEHGNRKISEKNRDLAEMVSLCSNNGYTLKVNFKKFKAYKANDHVRALFVLNDKMISDFQNRQHNYNNRYDLADWFDNILDQIKGKQNG